MDGEFSNTWIGLWVSSASPAVMATDHHSLYKRQLLDLTLNMHKVRIQTVVISGTQLGSDSPGWYVESQFRVHFLLYARPQASVTAEPGKSPTSSHLAELLSFVWSPLGHVNSAHIGISVCNTTAPVASSFQSFRLRCCYCTHNHLHACYMTCSSHPPRADHPRIWSTIQILTTMHWFIPKWRSAVQTMCSV